MIEYGREKLSDIKEELLPLLEDHYEEVAMYRDKIQLSPDWDKYLTLESLDMLCIATVRDEGVLVGYYICLVISNPHYSGDLYSINDIVLIKKEYRNEKVGVGLFLYVEKWMRERGVSVMSVHMKTFLPFDKLCEGLGWDYAERLYTKCIKED